MARKSSRRDFLKGKAASDSMADRAGKIADQPDADSQQTGTDEEGYLIRVSRRAMACQFEVLLNAGQYPGSTEAALEALDLVDELEAQLSVFLPSSEISRLNQTAADGPVEVEPRLFALIELCQQLFVETGGAFDVTSAPLWQAWGFARRSGALPDDEELAEARKKVGGHLVQIDAESVSVGFRRAGVELNLGGIGKGFALDRCAEVLADSGTVDFLLHGGQSSVLAMGSRSSTPAASQTISAGWVVGLRHPMRPRIRLAEIRLRDRALSTSGSGTQFFRHEGRRYGHILDPRTGQPAEAVLSATVIAPRAAVADALSTAFYVMGAEASLAYCQNHPELAAIIVCPSAGGAGFELHTAGFEPDELRILNPW